MDNTLLSTVAAWGFVAVIFYFLLYFFSDAKSNRAEENDPRKELFAHINELYEAERYGELERLLKYEISKNEKDVELRKVLVNVYMDTQRANLAARQLELIIRLTPKNLAARGKLVECYAQIGRMKQAVALAEEIYRDDPRNMNAVKILADLYMSVGSARQALATYRAYAELSPEEAAAPEFQQAMARLYAETGEFEDALATYELLQQSNPEDLGNLTMCLELAQRLERWGKCVELSGKIVAVAGETSELLEKVAQFHFNLSNWDEALACYDKLLRFDDISKSDRLQYQNSMSEIYINKGDSEKAINALTGLIEDNPSEDFLVFTLAQAYVSLNNYEKAVELYENLANNLPQDQKAMVQKHAAVLMASWAEAIFAQGEYSKAFDKFLMAMKYDENNHDVCYKFGVSNLRVKSINDAIGNFKRAITIAPREAKYYYALGCANEQLGNSKSAQTAFEEALSIEPKNTTYMTGLGVLHAKQFIHIEDGIELFKKVLDARPKDADATYNLALAYDILGKRDDAIHHYKRALELLPTHLEAKHNLSLLLGVDYNIDEIEMAER
jgi:tetratricopeptide (TPR) repeat protein